MKKDRFYFPHDHFARQDEKIKKLIIKEGFEGYGIYWSLVELLHENNGQISHDPELLTYELRIEYERIKTVLLNYGLFDTNENIITSKRVIQNIEERENKSEKARQSINKRWNDTNVIRTKYEDNTIKESKVKEIKGEEIKTEPPPEFSNVFYSISEIKERFLQESDIEKFCRTLKCEKEPAMEFINDWLNKKELSGDFHYPLVKLKSFLIKDFELNQKQTNGTQGNYKPNDRERRRIGVQDYENFKL